MSNPLDIDGGPRRTGDFDEAYTGTPPWEIGHPQPGMAALLDAGRVTGRVLDVGCGTGKLTLLASSRGLDATGVDSSPRAIAIARDRAAERGLTGARFEVGDALDLSWLGAQFDTVLDSGVFTSSRTPSVPSTSSSIRRVLVAGGRYHLMVFSDAQPGDWDRAGCAGTSSRRRSPGVSRSRASARHLRGQYPRRSRPGLAGVRGAPGLTSEVSAECSSGAITSQ